MDKKELPPGLLLVRQARVLLIGATLLWGLSFPLLRGLELAQKTHAPGISYPVMACGDMAEWEVSSSSARSRMPILVAPGSWVASTS